MRLVQGDPKATISVMCVGARHYEHLVRGMPPPTRMFLLSEGFVDPGGKPYGAFYCAECAKNLEHR